MSNHQVSTPNGYRIAWFIPVEMIMSGTLLFLTLRGLPWVAATVFIMFFVPLFIALERYLPKPVYKSMLDITAPDKYEYDLSDSKQAAKYNEDVRVWIRELRKHSESNTSQPVILGYKRTPLPFGLEKLLSLFKNSKTLKNDNLTKRQTSKSTLAYLPV